MENKIYIAICNIINEIGAIGKNKTNTQQNFKYRGIDDVMNALQPLLAKHHVFVVPTVLEQHREDKQTKAGNASYLSIFKIKYTFYADDGSFVEAVTVGESMDTGDKGSNKAMAIAFKYALFQVFCIPTEEMPDPDAETPPETTHKVQKVEQKPPVAKPTDLLTKEQIAEFQKLCIVPEDKERLKQARENLGYNKLSEVKASDYTRLMDQFNGIGLPFTMGEEA